MNFVFIQLDDRHGASLTVRNDFGELHTLGHFASFADAKMQMRIVSTVDSWSLLANRFDLLPCLDDVAGLDKSSCIEMPIDRGHVALVRQSVLDHHEIARRLRREYFPVSQRIEIVQIGLVVARARNLRRWPLPPCLLTNSIESGKRSVGSNPTEWFIGRFRALGLSVVRNANYNGGGPVFTIWSCQL